MAILCLESTYIFMKAQTTINHIDDLICPICNCKVSKSEYLSDVFRDKPKINYLAHLVTHYRHHHITSWNRCWGYSGNRYRGDWFGDYDEEKQIVNERAKRQIIRKGKEVLLQLGITPTDFSELQGTEEKTMDVAKRYLSKIQ